MDGGSMSHEVNTFIIIFDNSKRLAGKPLQRYDAVGVQFTRTGHVVLDTYNAPRSTFRNIEEMREVLGQWGKVELTWMEQEVAV